MPLNLYDQQKRNIANTRLFIAGFVCLLAFMGLSADGVLYAGGFSPGLPIATLGALCLGGFSAWWSLAGGDRAILESTSAAPIRGTACSKTSSKKWRSRRGCPSPRSS